MSTEPSSLTPDERALAERLARISPRAEPSPALDARVLASARDAVAVPQRRHRRWPAVLGLVASLVLAVGLAWRLRPVPDAGPQARVPTLAAPVSTESAARNDTAEQPMADTFGRIAGDHDSAVAPHADTLPPEVPAETPRPPASDSAPAASMARSKVSQGNPATGSQPAAAPPQLESTPIESPPPSPPPPAAAAAATTTADDAAPQTFERAAPPATPEPAVPSQASGDEATRAANAGGDEPSLEVPPATADSPAVRDAWLQRIQALVDDGDIAGAKTSLRAFVLRYPDYTLPENLRALAR
jgi:hypothetical protein